jgi:hypothetical protein
VKTFPVYETRWSYPPLRTFTELSLNFHFTKHIRKATKRIYTNGETSTNYNTHNFHRLSWYNCKALDSGNKRKRFESHRLCRLYWIITSQTSCNILGQTKRVSFKILATQHAPSYSGIIRQF